MTDPTHKAPPAVNDLAGAEREILSFWADNDIFARSLKRPSPKGPFVFHEGPPTANNVPHVGHTLTRTIKDLIPRFRTMRGYHVARKAGWDTHGLPVEISIEKELGFTDKLAIEQYGIEPFNAKCEQSVRRYEREWVAMSEQLGFWLDYDGAYLTFTNDYIESVWWILNKLFSEDYLYEGHKVLPYCPLCGTTHSSHEVAQAYKDVKDPSITVAMQVLPGQSKGGFDFGDNSWISIWTTTPWTLPSNMAACVHPEHEYVLVASKAWEGRRYLIAKDIAVPVHELIDNKPFDLRTQPHLATFRGADLEGLQYQPLFDFTGTGTDAETERGNNWSIRVDEYVTLDSGTGVVHIAPAFGEDDHRVGKRDGLSMYCAMEGNGKFKDHAGSYAGKWFKDVDPEVIGDLKYAGNMVRSEKYEHPYPHCWRHGTPLYYFATSSWFVKTTAIKDQLIAGNKKIAWNPQHIQDGRFGKWLEGVVDWALSRRRYWGTPLPIWRCTDCGQTRCVGSYEDLFANAVGRELPADPYDRAQLNPHRPFVDDITFECECGAEMRRVSEVIDCWFDAGAMPFAQHHYPFTEESRRLIDDREGYPADFISEAIDQTRGWFYTLHVIGTFLTGEPAYTSCICLGHVLDEQGKKMSKSLGNVVEPGPIMDQFGADAFRWFFYRSNATAPSRFGPNMVRESLKSFLLPLLNAWSFFTIYAEIDGFRPGADAPDFADRAPLDRWILSRLKHVLEEVTDHLDNNRVAPATAAIEGFVDGLTNWYIRRSRRRFWKGDDDADKAAAHHTLWEVLTTLGRLLAPFTPFLSERMHQDLVRPFVAEAQDSVHLEDWPELTEEDHDVLVRMDAARRIVTLGHAARQSSAVGVRQPLSKATIVTVSDTIVAALEDPLTAGVVRDELNVKELGLAEDRAEYVTYQVKPNFRTLGRRMGKRMPLVAKAVAQLDQAATVATWEAEERLVLELADGEPVELTGEDLDVRIRQREGTSSAFDEAALVALDTSLTDALVREGIAREVISKLQGMRKDADLKYDARIRVRWDAGEALAAAITEHAALVAGEVLATDFVHVEGLEGDGSKLKGEPLVLSIEEATA